MHRAVALASIVVLLAATAAYSLSDGDEEGNGFAVGTAPILFYQKYISDLRYGRCRFEPSCSHYAADAIEEYGFLEGATLAADRLVRCHRNARGYYSETAQGKLADPAGEIPRTGGRPLYPEWLLPAPLGPYVFRSDSARANPEPDREERMLEIIAFAGELSDRGDCYRAATEFKRFAFLMSDDRARWWAQMKIGECYFDRNEWKEAALEYGEAAVAGRSFGERNLALHLAAASHFDAGSYTRALRELVGLRPEDPADSARADFARGMCRLALGEWEESRELFRGIVRMAPEPPLGAAAAFLARKAQEGPNLPRKNATLAASLSAVVPGSGQVYAGRTYDGLRHFIFDGLLIYTVYWLFSEENYTGGYLLAAFTLPFYAGNIVGAGRSASQYNESRRLESVSRWIDEAGSR